MKSSKVEPLLTASHFWQVPELDDSSSKESVGDAIVDCEALCSHDLQLQGTSILGSFAQVLYVAFHPEICVQKA